MLRRAQRARSVLRRGSSPAVKCFAGEVLRRFSRGSPRGEVARPQSWRDLFFNCLQFCKTHFSTSSAILHIRHFAFRAGRTQLSWRAMPSNYDRIGLSAEPSATARGDGSQAFGDGPLQPQPDTTTTFEEPSIRKSSRYLGVCVCYLPWSSKRDEKRLTHLDTHTGFAY